MQHVYTVFIYIFVHTYKSNVVAPYVQLSLQLQCNELKYDTCLKIKQLACGHVSLFKIFVFSKLKIHWINFNH
jgi:hypothetical protein